MGDEYNIQHGYETASVSISERLVEKLKRLAELEDTNINKLFGQFIRNYVGYLDKSFVQGSDWKIAQERNIALQFYIPAADYMAFVKKIEREGLDRRVVLLRFVENYVGFVSNTYENEE